MKSYHKTRSHHCVYYNTVSYNKVRIALKKKTKRSSIEQNSFLYYHGDTIPDDELMLLRGKFLHFAFGYRFERINLYKYNMYTVHIYIILCVRFVAAGR